MRGGGGVRIRWVFLSSLILSEEGGKKLFGRDCGADCLCVWGGFRFGDSKRLGGRGDMCGMWL